MRRLLVLCLAVLWGPAGLAADLSSREERILEAVGASIDRASVKYSEGAYEESAKAIGRAIKQIDTAMNAATPELHDALQPAMKRIRTAHAMLQLEGVPMAPFREPERPGPNADAEQSDAGSPPDSMPSESSAPMVSFTSEVAPILVQRCGQCHIESVKGRFAMSSYAALMRGTPAGAVVFAGDVTASRLIAVIESGDMPRGSSSVSEEELKTLKDWVRGGAAFDGDDPQAPLGEANGPSPDPSPDASPGPTPIRRATGEETVSFAADVAPLLVENCKGCHLDAMQTRGGLRLDTFAQMMRGGDSGPLVVAGNAAESLLVQKLQGTVGNRMPAGGRPPLSEASMKLISTWIDEGATLDGASRDQPLTVMSQLAWAAEATPAEMSARRRALAEENLELVSASGGQKATAETDHFFVIGTASQRTVDRVGRVVESLLPAVRKNVPGETGEAYFSGRATITVLPRRYDYSEFAKMIEQRSIPGDWRSHWNFDGIDAYAALVAGDDVEDETLKQRLFERVVSLAVATRGDDVPRWFAEGVGVTLASREGFSGGRDARRQMQSETAEAIAAMDSAQAFLNERLTPQQTDRIGAAVTATMLDRTRRRRFDRLLRSLRDGVSFEKAFTQAFGGPPESFLDGWLKWARGASRG